MRSLDMADISFAAHYLLVGISSHSFQYSDLNSHRAASVTEIPSSTALLYRIFESFQ
jgi:hypothetical protein